MAGPVPVTFEPAGRTVWVQSGQTVLSAARRAGVLIPAPCGSRGVCGGCGVRVLQGSLEEPDAGEIRALGLAPPNVRMACLARVREAVTVRPVVVLATSNRVTRGDATPRGPIVAAVDLGTTTVAAAVIDGTTGAEIGRATVENHQVSWGADVLSRIDAAIGGAGPDLRAAAEASILGALGAACDDAGSCVRSIGRLVIAGNTTMASLLLGADVTSLAGHPFDPPVVGSAMLPEDSTVLSVIAPDASTLVLPALGGFIGGDTTAGLVATGLAESTAPGLLVDLGTNAEIVCAAAGGLFGASAAAGPAFEGFGIHSGGPAAPGAIEHVQMVDGDLTLTVVGGGEPRWLCGSGLVSAIALLRRTGHLDAEGLLRREGPLEARCVRLDDVLALDLSHAAPRNGDGSPRLLLTQQDVRAFQLAKGAVLTAIRLVLERTGVKASGLQRVLIAGAFGGALNSDDLVELGVVPRSLAGKMSIVGNAALAGAAMAALDPEIAERAESLGQGFTHVDLAADPRFAAAYLSSMSLEPAGLD